MNTLQRILVLLVVCGCGPVATASDALPFAHRLEEALASGAAAEDALWAPGTRSDARRELGYRAASLFRWDGVLVRSVREGREGTNRVVEVAASGTARWEDRGYGVAQALWPLQLDERARTNRVTRRMAWVLREENGVWRAVAQEELSLLAVEEARIHASVHPAQGVLLVDSELFVRALVPVETVRFLLDRPAEIYDLTVDGELAEVARGAERGGLGLLGYSPPMDGSFRLPRPLAVGETVRVRIRTREPLGAFSGEGTVTTLPVSHGPFATRVWIPLFGPVSRLAPEATRVELTVTWPRGAFASCAFPARHEETIRAVAEDLFEEDGRVVRWTGDLRNADFLLRESGLEVPVTLGKGAAASVHPRSREALASPLLPGSSWTSTDLNAELAELLPMDRDLMEERSEEFSGDADQGGGDREQSAQ
ncbi:MAG: hypothetical protein QF819_09100 [Gemmatimonadota bacterium]|nr:hypothetical protein [Gemmatimonadota bacterium]MDP6460373.1 hypothetical protein [Gemmatimonadota bacterium]MDP6528544.1 hypothetical protein [Gemmatimonadota bacterium]MDP6803312.1 hypothetical protein [Gemmatimonadota bacterium]MDP7032319.1 hypothetical protein [Gemmatimonadota bacterium]